MLLGLMSILLLLAVYNASIRRTVKAAKTNGQLKSKIERAATAPSQIADLQNKLNSFQQTAIQPYNREALLEAVTTFCRKKELLVKTFPEANSYQQENDQIITNEIEVEGNYTSIVELVYLLEQQEKLGSLSSLDFYKYKDRRLRKNTLRAKIVLRNLKDQI